VSDNDLAAIGIVCVTVFLCFVAWCADRD